MADEHDRDSGSGGDRPPPEIEDLRALKWILGGSASAAFPALPYSREDVHGFRPIHRPPVPVLTVLDDGSLEHGQAVRLRGETFTIGRTGGDLVLANDAAISGLHAEIRRIPWKGSYQWQLVDLDSVNGTFVRGVRAVLHGEAIVILGARRFRLRNPLVSHRGAPHGTATRLIDSSGLPQKVWPTLVETSQRSACLEFPLHSDTVSIGRTGGGADIQLDDPLIADRHAQLERQRDGSWLVVAETTRNGVWISSTAVTLTSHCHFRCGEQLFRFEIP
jgi:pSer/pThr/pTyr-binding forkhead associated (FHA) protein